jgi:hypothetical protein
VSIAHPEPFDQFLRGLASATYADYAHRPGTRVRDAQTFEQMRTYLLDYYQGARAEATIVIADGVVDCLARPGTTSASTVDPTGCPAGTVPVRRMTLDRLVRFSTLQGFLGKDPGGGGALPPVPSSSR